MSSSVGNSIPSSSQPSSLVPPVTESSGGKAPKVKKKVTIEVDGFVVGEHSQEWSSHTGDFVRAHIPISYDDIEKVPKNFKDDVWNSLMQKENPRKNFTQVDKWLAAHEHSDGTPLESAKSKYDEVKAAGKIRKSNSLTDEEYSEDFDNDELTQVFGKEKNKGVRAMGSRISKRQLLHIQMSMSKTEGKKKANEEATSLEDKIISYIDLKFQNFEGIIMSLASKLSNASTPPLTPLSDVDFNSVNRPTHLVQNLNDVFVTTGVLPSPHSNRIPNNKPPVILLDKFGKELAKGYVVTNAATKLCHFKQVGIGEKEVYIEEVFEPDARLWEAQGGHDTLAGFVQGGFLIWLECWLKYV